MNFAMLSSNANLFEEKRDGIGKKENGDRDSSQSSIEMGFVIDSIIAFRRIEGIGQIQKTKDIGWYWDGNEHQTQFCIWLEKNETKNDS